jgi:hypothetical protein
MNARCIVLVTLAAVLSIHTGCSPAAKSAKAVREAAPARAGACADPEPAPRNASPGPVYGMCSAQ